MLLAYLIKMGQHKSTPVNQQSVMNQLILDMVESDKNDLKMLEEIRDNLVAQQIINENALKSAEVIGNLNKKTREHLNNATSKLDRAM